MVRLDLESINNLIANKITESLNLDYKRELDEHNNEIAKLQSILEKIKFD